MQFKKEISWPKHGWQKQLPNLWLTKKEIELRVTKNNVFTFSLSCFLGTRKVTSAEKETFFSLNDFYLQQIRSVLVFQDVLEIRKCSPISRKLATTAVTEWVLLKSI